MSEIDTFKTSISQNICHPASEIRESGKHLNRINLQNSEPFGIHITAVEDNNIEIKNSSRKDDNFLDTEKLYNCINKLTNEVTETKINLKETKNGFKLIMLEMERQLEVASQREAKAHTKYLLLQIEKEKLMTLLESKSNLILKLKKELMNARRIIRFKKLNVNKKLRCFFHLPENFADLEYTEFESGFKNESSNLLLTKDTIDVVNDSSLSSNI